MTRTVPQGVYAPVLTPFHSDLGPDRARFIAHARWLAAQQVGLAVFGTNSEAVSLSLAERLALTDALLEAQLPGARLLPGTGLCSIAETVQLTSHAVRHGACGVLMLPPFYYKPVGDDGLFAYFSEVIQRVGDARLAIVLYHIPQLSQVPIGVKLVERLLERYPGTVAGIKDSAGDWAYTEALIRRFAPRGFAVFPGSEAFLTRALAIGGAGCISATANVNPAGIQAVFDRRGTAEATELQARADAVRGAFQAFPMIAAMKHVVAGASGAPSWRTVRPPLASLGAAEAQALDQALAGAGFELRGYPRAEQA